MLASLRKLFYRLESRKANLDSPAFTGTPSADSLKIIDPDYVPFEGTLDADIVASVASNDNVANNAGTILATNHWVGFSTDFKVTSSGANKWLLGHMVQLRTGGGYTGSPTIAALWVSACNRLQTGSPTPYVNAIYGSINLEGDATEAVVADLSSFRGNTNTCPTIIGVRSVAGNGYSACTTLTGGEFVARTISNGATVTNSRSIHAKQTVTSGHTVTSARGLSLDGWSNAGTITASYGIYADTSIDVGTTKYFIYSLSVSPSFISGDLIIGGAGKFFISTEQTPASASAAGVKGQIAWDADFIYVCIATNTWKRTALSTW